MIGTKYTLATIVRSIQLGMVREVRKVNFFCLHYMFLRLPEPYEPHGDLTWQKDKRQGFRDEAADCFGLLERWMMGPRGVRLKEGQDL